MARAMSLDPPAPASWEDIFADMPSDWAVSLHDGFKVFVAHGLKLDDLAYATATSLVQYTPPQFRSDMCFFIDHLQTFYPSLFVLEPKWLRYTSETKTVEGHDYRSVLMDQKKQPSYRSFSNFPAHLAALLHQNNDAVVECLDLSGCVLFPEDLEVLVKGTAKHLNLRRLEAILLCNTRICLFGEGNASDSEDDSIPDNTGELYKAAHWKMLGELLSLNVYVDVTGMNFFGNEDAYSKLSCLPRADKLIWVSNAEDAKEEPEEHLVAYAGGRKRLLEVAEEYYSVDPPYAERCWSVFFESDLAHRMARARGSAMALARRTSATAESKEEPHSDRPIWALAVLNLATTVLAVMILLAVRPKKLS